MIHLRLDRPRLLAGILLGIASCSFANPAQAASCWAVTGWSSTDYVGAQALLTAANCTVIPQNEGWVQVVYDYGPPPSDDLWLRIPLNDPHVTGWLFQPLLVFSHYDGNQKPVVITDLLVPTGPNSNYHWLLPYPPAQGVPAVGSRVRLRHLPTGKCIYNWNQNGAKAENWDCWNDPGMVYVIDNAGGGLVRLRHEQSGQCLYAVNQNNGFLYNWGCWADPNMAFQLIPESGAYRLRHANTGQCVFGNSTNGGQVHTWGCWSDPNMLFRLDIL
jgi:Ricin-type beta-trefoil lectin domain-like